MAGTFLRVSGGIKDQSFDNAKDVRTAAANFAIGSLAAPLADTGLASEIIFPSASATGYFKLKIDAARLVVLLLRKPHKRLDA